MNITIPSFIGKSDYIMSYFTSKYQIPRELQQWRNLIKSESVDDETMIFKSTTTLHQIKAEKKLGTDTKTLLTKEWKEYFTNLVNIDHKGFLKTIPSDEEDTVFI